MSKHWGHQQVWNLLRPLLFWHGDIGSIPDDGKGSEKVSLDLGNKPDYKGPPSREDESKKNGQTAGPEDGQTKPAKMDHVHHILERKEGEPDNSDESEEGYGEQCGCTEATEGDVGT